MYWFIAAPLLLATLVLALSVVVAVFIAKTMRSPPFRRNDPQGRLSQDKHALHFLWGSATHDPLTDFGIAFKDVMIPAANPKYTLRGWLVPAKAGKPGQRLMLLVHGGGRDRRTFLRMLPFFTTKFPDTSFLMYDFRDHGTSDADGCGLTVSSVLLAG